MRGSRQPLGQADDLSESGFLGGKREGDRKLL
jgi:hypothetical protein